MMMLMQIAANGASGMARAFHSSAPSDDTPAAARSRLAAQTMGDAVEDHEEQDEAGDRRGQSCYPAGTKDALAHGFDVETKAGFGNG